jgi:hypothetical protein
MVAGGRPFCVFFVQATLLFFAMVVDALFMAEVRRQPRCCHAAVL